MEEADLQNNAPILDPGSASRLAGLVYTQDDDLGQAIGREVRPLCRIETVTGSVQDAIHAVGRGGIQACFVHITGEATDNGMALVRQLRRTHPENGVFIVADEKDPDLILQGLRMGVMDFILPAANGSERFLPALLKAMGRSAAECRNGFIYTFFSLKGGQGVTSVCVNLADRIQALTGGRVLLLDLNLYMGDVGTMVNAPPDFTPYDLIRDLSRMDEDLLFSSLYHHPRGFYVLPSPAAVSDAERVHRDQITAMLTLLKRHFAHIIIDLPHDLSERTLAAVEASDRLLILVEPDLVSVKSAQQVLEFFQELNYGDDRIAFVLNRLSKSSDLGPEDVQMVLKQPMLATVARDWQALARAARKGDPLAVSHGQKRIARDLHHLAADITGMAVAGSKPGLFGRWRSWLGG